MLKDAVSTALNEHIDDILRKLPSMKEEYAEQIETDRQILDPSDPSVLRSSIVHSITHDIRHESVMIFARNSGSRFPTDAEFQEMGELVEVRIPEIMALVDSLDWF